MYTGEYEKFLYTVVADAPNEEKAGLYAMIMECHNEPSISGDLIQVEDGYDFIYEVYNAIELSNDAFAIAADMELTICTYDPSMIMRKNFYKYEE